MKTTTTTTPTIEVNCEVGIGVPPIRYMVCHVDYKVIMASMKVDYSVFGTEYEQALKAFRLLHKHNPKEYYPGCDLESYLSRIFGDRFDEMAFEALKEEIFEKLEKEGVQNPRETCVFRYKGGIRHA